MRKYLILLSVISACTDSACEEEPRSGKYNVVWECNGRCEYDAPQHYTDTVEVTETNSLWRLDWTERCLGDTQVCGRRNFTLYGSASGGPCLELEPFITLGRPVSDQWALCWEEDSARAYVSLVLPSGETFDARITLAPQMP